MRISNSLFATTLALFSLASSGCILSITDGDTDNSDETTTTSSSSTGDATADAGDGDGDGDGDTSTGDGDGDASSGDGDGDSTSGDGDGDGDCDPYGNPGKANDMCCEGEMPLSIMGIEGTFCSPGCETSQDCPKLGDLDAQCVLGPSDGAAENCAVICDLAGDGSDCPAGASCQDIMQGGNTGICTHS